MAAMFTIDVITLFPEIFAPLFGLSIVGRAVERGIVRVRYHHLLEGLTGGERADAPPYGGGPGMVMRLEPIARALDAVLAEGPEGERRVIALTSPAGKPFRQTEAQRLAGLDRLVVICGHYEDVDQRLGSLYPLEAFSIGDFVLTGGEIPALAMIDATVRLLDGTIRAESLQSESSSENGLDFPSYTRPPVFRGVAVPDVLLSGDHAKIAAWRREQSRLRTAERVARLRDDALHRDEGP
jgi:tRNA (guanine37-N1)-methyltransferase